MADRADLRDRGGGAVERAPQDAPPGGASAGAGGELDGGSPVPEPATLLLVGSGLVGVAFTARQRRRRT